MIQLFLGLLGSLAIAGLSDVVSLDSRPRPVAWCVVLAAATVAFTGSKALSRRLAARGTPLPWQLKWAGVAIHLGAYAAVLYPLGWARWALVDLRWRGEDFMALFLLLAPAAAIALWLAPWSYLSERRGPHPTATLSFPFWLLEVSRPVLALSLGFLALAWAADRLGALPPVGEAMAVHRSLHVGLAWVGLLVLFAASPYLVLLAWPSAPFPPGASWDRLWSLAEGSPLHREAIRLWDARTASALNACVVGLIPSTRRIFFTRGMHDLLEPGDLAAVLSHELGHIRKGHMGFHLLAAGSFLLALAPIDAATAAMPGWISGSIFLLYTAGYWLFFFGPASRWLEIEADLAGADAVGMPSYTAALQKVGDYIGPAARKTGWRHFSLERRLGLLAQSAEDASARAWVTRRFRLFRRAMLLLGALSAGAFAATAANDFGRPREEISVESARMALGEAEELRALLSPVERGIEPSAVQKLFARSEEDIEAAYRAHLDRALFHLRTIGPEGSRDARDLLEEASRASR